MRLALYLPNVSKAPGDGSGEVAYDSALGRRGARTGVQGEGSGEGHGFFADLEGGEQSARGGVEGGAEFACEQIGAKTFILSLQSSEHGLVDHIGVGHRFEKPLQ